MINRKENIGTAKEEENKIETTTSKTYTLFRFVPKKCC